jgi:hypothetical protein
MDLLFPDAVPADAEHVGRAKGFVGALRAQGGTEMLPAMKAALADPREAKSGSDGGRAGLLVHDDRKAKLPGPASKS